MQKSEGDDWICNSALLLQPSSDGEPAGHALQDGAVESRVVQRLQEGDQILLPSAPHIQAARQRIDLILAHLRVQSAGAAVPLTSQPHTIFVFGLPPK